MKFTPLILCAVLVMSTEAAMRKEPSFFQRLWAPRLRKTTSIVEDPVEIEVDDGSQAGSGYGSMVIHEDMPQEQLNLGGAREREARVIQNNVLLVQTYHPSITNEMRTALRRVEQNLNNLWHTERSYEAERLGYAGTYLPRLSQLMDEQMAQLFTSKKGFKLLSNGIGFKNGYLFQVKCNPYKERQKAVYAIVAKYMQLVSQQSKVMLASQRPGARAEAMVIAKEQLTWMQWLLSLYVGRHVTQLGNLERVPEGGWNKYNNIVENPDRKAARQLVNQQELIKQQLAAMTVKANDAVHKATKAFNAFFSFGKGKMDMVWTARQIVRFQLQFQREMLNLLAFTPNTRYLSKRFCEQPENAGWTHLGRWREAKKVDYQPKSPSKLPFAKLDK